MRVIIGAAKPTGAVINGVRGISSPGRPDVLQVEILTNDGQNIVLDISPGEIRRLAQAAREFNIIKGA